MSSPSSSAATGPFALPDEMLTVAGTAYGATPEAQVLVYAARARRFVLVLLLLLLSAGIAPGLKFAYGIDLLQDLRGVPVGALLAGYIWVLHAFMVGSTSRATGQGFWPVFMLALFPPTLPLAWARIAGRKWWKPYVLFGIVAVLALALAFPARQAGWALQLLALLTIPFLVSFWFGGSIVEIARIMGLSPYVGGAFLCVGPAVLCGFTFWDLGLGDTIVGGLQSGSTWATIAQACRECLATADFGYNVTGLWMMWAVIALGLWIKSIHDNLRFPLF